MSVELIRRLTKMAWVEVGRAQTRNPWLELAGTGDKDALLRWNTWNERHIGLMRQLFAVVFGENEPSEELLAQALDFLEK